MKKIWLFSLLLGICLFITACGGNEEASSAQKESIPNYEIVLEEKAKRTEQMQIRVTTESNDESEIEAIVKEIMDKYKNEGLDSIHLYIHEYDSADLFGQFKAKGVIAYTQKGAAQVGLTKANSYDFEIENKVNAVSTTNEEDYSSPEWQESFQQIAISEAGRYIELTERDGELPIDRLEEHSRVVQQQADKMIDDNMKQQFQTLAQLIKDNKLEEVKELVNNLKGN